MQRLLCVLLWVAYTCPLFAQPGFNQVYDLGYARNQLRTLIVVRDTVVACGIARADTFPHLQCLLVARFDSNGTVLDHRLICDSLGRALAVAENWTDIVATSDGGYAFTAAAVSYNGLLVKLRNDLSVEFIQEYVDTVNLTVFYNAIIVLPDGYLLGGHVQRPNYVQDAFLRKVDEQGNSIWFSYYGEYAISDLFNSYYQLNDSLIIFVGSYKVSNNTLSGRGPWICIINLTGEIVKEWRPNDNVLIDYIFALFSVDAEDWIVYGLNTISGPPFEYQPYIALLDTNFQIESVRPFDPIGPSLNFLEDVRQTSDGNYIGAGLYYSEDPNNEPGVYGRLFKFSPEPDSLWSLTLAAPPTADIAGSGNYFGGVGVLSSGNIIAGGYASAGNDVWPWLVKVTPDGCVDTLWCVATPAWEPVELQLKTPGVKMWPNPAHDHFFLDLPARAEPAQLTLTTPDGRLVLRKTTFPSDQVDISALPAGIYFWHVALRNGQVASGKLVIQR